MARRNLTLVNLGFSSLWALAACGDDSGSQPGEADPNASSTANSTRGSSESGTHTGPSDTTSSEPDESSTTSDPIGTDCPYTPVEGEPTFALEVVAEGFTDPLLVVGDPVDPDVLYVAERDGTIKRLEPGETTAPAENWLELDVDSSGSETGLFGLAFHPDYASNGLVYVSYSATRESWFVTEFAVSEGSVDESSARNVFGSAQPAHNHNGGMIQFGPDDMLYISVGDGGPQGDGCGNGQNGNTHHGSILRIDVAPDEVPDSATSCGTESSCACPTVDGFDFTIPDDNPFVGTPDVRDEIYAYGFRNPWRFSFDPEDGRLYVADVGQDEWEEVSAVEAGGNYGWGDMEGNHCFADESCDESAMPGQPNSDGLIAPIAEYPHAGDPKSIIGLGSYRSCEVPAFAGTYFYADYLTREIWGVTYDGAVAVTGDPVGSAPLSPRGGGTNAYGDVFVAAGPLLGGAEGGTVYRITAGS